ncbi:ABC transporter permease [Nocardioides caeni]|uniref:ABC transporter permease n=1 Tax=Nocardioides caeni TaxID=574700 RepID=A0A4S8NAK1_9ACTN|nr:ABC transporter permease [Nocardioides caeni]THV13340.1 ABC transporter permease [Nocardioides caeni]
MTDFSHHEPGASGAAAESGVPLGSLSTGPVEPDGGAAAPARSPGAEAWRELRRKPMFWISATVIFVFLLMAVWPSLFTDIGPRDAVLADRWAKPSAEHWFGRDLQGYDLYTRCIYGARASILVGLLTATLTALVGGFLGLIAGYMGGITDTLLSRLAEVFFAIPLLLGAIIFLFSFSQPNDGFFKTVMSIVLILVILGWPSVFRLMRSSVLQVKPNDYVQAARALGGSPLRIAFRHILPNAIGPVIVVSTINLGVYIASEAALSFLGIGLQDPTVSWGQMIDEGSEQIRNAPHTLLFPAGFLSAAVLGFIMLGDTIRDAFDPKSR